MTEVRLVRKTAVVIKPEYAGCRALDFVAARFTYRSREEWRQELDAGRFLLNGVRAVSQSLLAAGDRLVYLLARAAGTAGGSKFCRTLRG